MFCSKYNLQILGLFLAVVTFLMFQINDVFATTCNFYGDTAYCTDSTGKTTTYNQYGDNIYGSDGSSATIYHDPVSGMGSGLPSVSTAGVDMDSPEMKEAQAKYDEACNYEGFNGGAQATNCRNAVAEWLEALSKAPRIDTSSDAGDDDYSDYSNSNDEDLDEWTKKLLSDFGISNEGSKSTNLCVERGIPNSHQEGNYCPCDDGYINNNNKCVPISIASCEFIYGKGAVPRDANSCKCGTGYVGNSSGDACIPANNSEVNSPSSLQQSQKVIENIPVDFDVKPEDILPLSETGKTNTEATLRVCPSTQCSKVGSYPEGTVVEIVGKYKNDTWFKINVVNSNEGWMHQSLVDEVIKQGEVEKADTPEPIRMTREEYDAKYGVPTPNADKPDEIKEEKVGWWRKIFSWFGF